jgi:predicted component of type VI protein secretion system
LFLERKFMSPSERRAVIDAAARTGLPAPVQAVVHNLERVLSAERGIGHVLPDYGLSRSGHWSVEGLLSHATAQLRETLPRYEPRLAIDDIETDLDDDGRPLVLVLGRIAGARVTIAIDPLHRRVHAVHLA